VDYLKKHKVTVFEGQDDLARNEAFEHLARHLGQHFSLLANFYEKMKRAVATGRTTRVDIEGYTEAERSAAVQLGTLLYRHGMLKDFYYHRSPRKQLRVIPTKDGETQQFLTGGWLEIYVVWLLSKRLRGHLEPSQFQVLFNVKGTLPTGNEFEADLMASINGHLLWLECKTGQWQDYSARFRGLVKVFGTNRKGAGLVLIKTPDSSTKARATDMLDMTLLSLDDVETYVDEYLEIPEGERLPKQHKVPQETSSQQRNAGRGRGPKSEGDGEGEGNSRRRRRSAASSGGRGSGRGSGRSGDSQAKVDPETEVVPTSPEDATPLENPEPAKRLGKVDLEDGRAIPRRRRRRRSRSRSSEEGSGGSASADRDGDKAEPLRKDLAIKPLDGEGKAEKSDRKSGAQAESKAAEPAKPLIPEGMVAPKPNWPEVTEDKAAKDVEGKADREAANLEGESDSPEAKAKRPRRRRRTKKVTSEEAPIAADSDSGSDSKEAAKPGRPARPAKSENDGDAAESEAESKPKKKPRGRAAKKSVDELTAKDAPAVSESKDGEEAKPAKDGDAEEKAKPRAKRKTTRSRSKPVKAESEAADSSKKSADAEQSSEAKPVRKKRVSKKKTTRKKSSTSAPKVEGESKPEKAAEPAEAKPEKPQLKSESKPAAKPAAKSDADGRKKKSASGVTIMPDLSAMMAGSSKPKSKDSKEAKSDD